MNNVIFSAQNRGHITAPTTYELLIQMTGNGDTEPEPNIVHTYTESRVVQVEALADSGYHFYHWIGDIETTDNPAFVSMNADKSITAVFTQNDTYTLTTAVTGHGSIRPNSGTYEDGTVVNITAVPDDSNHEFDHWTGDLSGDTNPTTITMDADKSVTAVFIKTKMILTMSSTGNGDISPTAGTHEYDYGSSVTLLADNFDTNYMFWVWDGYTTTDFNPKTFIIHQNRSYEAIFHNVFVDYGFLYNGWVAVENGWNLIDGLTIPTASQWGTLTTYAENEGPGSSWAGYMLKESGDDHFYGNIVTSNYFGLSLIPGGSRWDYGFFGIRHTGNYWSSTSSHPFGAWEIYYKAVEHDTLGFYTRKSPAQPQRVGMSIRLIRDLTTSEQNDTSLHDGDVIEVVQDYDANNYDLIRIGQFGITASNLKTTHYKSGVFIPNLPLASDWANTEDGARCVYGNY